MNLSGLSAFTEIILDTCVKKKKNRIQRRHLLSYMLLTRNHMPDNVDNSHPQITRDALRPVGLAFQCLDQLVRLVLDCGHQAGLAHALIAELT